MNSNGAQDPQNEAVSDHFEANVAQIASRPLQHIEMKKNLLFFEAFMFLQEYLEMISPVDR